MVIKGNGKGVDGKKNDGKSSNFSLNDYIAIFNKLPIPLMLINETFIIVDLNLRAKEELSITNNLKGKKLLDYFTLKELNDYKELIKRIEAGENFVAQVANDQNQSVKLTIEPLSGKGFIVTLKKTSAHENFVNEVNSHPFGLVQTLLDSLIFPFCIIDTVSGKVIMKNIAYKKLENSIIAIKSHERMPRLFNDNMLESFNFSNVLTSREPFTEEHEYSTKEGEKLIYEIHGYPLTLVDDKPHYVIFHLQNISIHKLHQQELEEYRSTLNDLFCNLPGMVFRCLNENNWTMDYVSPGCKGLTGYSSKDIINNNKIRFGDLIHPDDRERVWTIIQAAINRKRPFTIEYRIITRRGVVKWVTEKGRARYDKYEKVVSIEGFIADISKGKNAEINLKRELQISEATALIGMRLLEDSITPVEVSRLVQNYLKEFTGSKFSLIYSLADNKSSITLFNHDTHEESFEIDAKQYSEERFKFLQQQIDNPNPFIQNNPVDIILPGYQDVESEVTRYACIPAFVNNKLTGILILGNSQYDYNEETLAIAQRFVNMFALGLYRLKAEETLQDAKEQAEESDRLKSLFLSNMSHEIRTPMNAIVGFAEMLQDTDLNRDQKNRFLDVIIKSGDNLLRLINDIIDISKIEAGQLKFVYSDTLVNEMIIDLETFYKQELIRLKKQHLDILINLGQPGNDFAMYTDADRLKQVMNNLIGNAVKFTDEGFIEFGYQIKTSVIEFYVRDSGIGIASEKQEVIFERFGQVQEAVSRNQSGTGLGLTISRNLVERLGGTIWVDSYPGEGSTFYFSLPLRISKLNTRTSTKAPVKNDKEQLDLQGKTILVVEDVDTNYFYLSSLLSKLNCNVIRATNGMKAIEMCKENSAINLVLMDIELPLLDGYKATTEIKKFKPTLPVIAQTAFAMMGERERSKEAGCDDYLAKPIRKEELLSVISKYL